MNNTKSRNNNEIAADEKPTTPLLSKAETTESSSAASSTTGEESFSSTEDALRTAAMLTLVLTGLALVLLVFFWPLMLYKCLRLGILKAVVVEVLHVVALVYVPFPYLYLHRLLCLPIRILLMPLVHEITKSETIKEKETVWYNSCSDFVRNDNADDADTANPRNETLQTILQTFKSSVRKDVKKKLRLFQEAEITTQTKHSNYLSLKDDIPIVWSHEIRTTTDDKSVTEEFLKRFLVLFLTPHAYLDRYFDQDGRQCGVYLFVACDNVLSSFMYFCDLPDQGIWQYNHIRALCRGVVGFPHIQYVNYHLHQPFAKRLAGAQVVHYTDTDQLKKLYPFRFFREPPQEVIPLELNLDSLLLKRKNR